MDLEVVLKGALPPILAAMLLVTFCGVRLLPLAMAAGLFVAYALLRRELPDTPFTLWSTPDGRQWLLWGVIGAGVVALLEHLRVLTTRTGALLGFACAAGSLWLMLSKQAARWTMQENLVYVGGGALAAGVIVLACRRAILRAPAGIGAAVVFVLLLSADSMLLALLDSNALLGQLCGAVAAALGAGAATVLWRSSFSMTIAEGTWLGCAHALFVLASAHLGDVPWLAMACALFAPCALLLVPAKEQRPVRWTMLSLLAIAVPMAAAAWLTSNAAAY